MAFAPSRLGRYALLRPLAVGGMGELFLARADGAPNLVVIKKLRASLAHEPEFVTRFADEVRTASRLRHPAIARVLDHGTADGAPFIAMEYVHGRDVKAVLERTRARGVRMPTAVALHVAVRVLEALAYAHAQTDEQGQPLHLVHRDVSPPNVLLSFSGEVKVIDFGLAKSQLSQQHTQTGAILGKLLYMPPESRKQPLDARADLFSLAVVLHELLSGQHELEGLAPGEVLARMANPRFAPLAGRVFGVTPALDAALQKALQPRPEQRFASADEMRAALQGVLRELAPNVGPDTLATFLQTMFAEEYAREQAELAQLGGPMPAWGEASTLISADAYHSGTRPSAARPDTLREPVLALAPETPEPKTLLETDAAAAPPEPTSQPTVDGSRRIWLAAGAMFLAALLLLALGLAFGHSARPKGARDRREPGRHRTSPRRQLERRLRERHVELPRRGPR